MAKILVVDDDLELADSIVNWLKLEQHTVEVANSGEDGLQLIEQFQFELILLDWGLPNISGYDLLRTIRSAGNQTPVIFLTGRDDIDSKEFGLDGGADDYLTKPFDMRELSARVRSRLRRPRGLVPQKIIIGNVLLDSEYKRVLVDNKAARLTNKEYALLEFLMRHKGQVFSAKAVMDAVWPSDSESSEDTVRACMKNLRRKISFEGQECIVKTIPGSGYVVGDPES